jgi:hypothetical protein
MAQEIHVWYKTMIHDRVHCNTSYVQGMHQNVVLCLENQHFKIGRCATTTDWHTIRESGYPACPMGYVRDTAVVVILGVEKAAEIQ